MEVLSCLFLTFVHVHSNITRSLVDLFVTSDSFASSRKVTDVCTYIA